VSFWDEINAEFVVEKITESSGAGLAWYGDAVMNATRNAVQVACKEGAEKVARDARRNVPKDDGDLRDSIKVEPSKFKDGGYLVVAQGPGNYDRFYATFVELGHYSSLWGLYGRKGKGFLGRLVSGKKMRPIEQSPIKIEKQPYLRPALRKNKRAMQRAFENLIKE